MVSDDISPVVLEAANRWARTVRGAPKNFPRLVTRVVVKDEVVCRTFTIIARRDLKVERGSSQERGATRPRANFDVVDPFAHTAESLLAATLHVGACETCSGRCTAPCPPCRASGRANCPNCGGAGRFRNPSTNRMNNCKECKATGNVACARCSGTGRVGCATCSGSGHQRIWLSFAETHKSRVSITPDTPAKVAHRQLAEPRLLASQEMGAFTVQLEHVARGPVAAAELDADAQAVLQAEWAKVDRRLERIVQQQFIRFAVPRRDVFYQMCGTTGVLPLSGKSLAGATTPEAIRPIRRRIVIAVALVFLLSLVAIVPAGTMMGHAHYFESTTGIAVWTWLGAVLVSIPWVAGLLRAWRPGRQWGGLTRSEQVCGVLWGLAWLSMLVGGILIRPDVEQVTEALAAGDVERAGSIVEALREREGATPAVGEAEDAVLLAEAASAQGEVRREKLDTVAAHGGTHAEAAAATARGERLGEVRSLVAEDRPDEALAAIDRLYRANWRTDPEVAEERARVFDLRVTRCADDVCRLLAGREARESHESDARGAVVRDAHARLTAHLERRDASGETAVGRLHALTEFTKVAQRVIEVAKDDKELAATALAAKVWVEQEREKFAALGADGAVLAALFPELRRTGADVMAATVEGIDVYFDIDGDGHCEGIYAVGPVGRRVLRSSTWSADRLLSQAVGYPATVRRPAKPSDTRSKWVESGKKVEVRWRDGEPVELRVGAAKP